MRIEDFTPRDIEKEELIIKVICSFFTVTREELFSKSRPNHLAIPRMFVSYYFRFKLRYSLKRIGRILNKDHSTIIHHIRTFEDMSANKMWRKNKYLIERMLNKNAIDEEYAEALYQVTQTKKFEYHYMNFA